MTPSNKKQLIFVFVALIIAFALYSLKATPAGEYLTLDFLKAQKDRLFELYQRNPLLVISVYMAIYIAVTGLSIPGAAVMSLAAGAIFGLLLGTIIVSFSSTIGATCAFFISRTLMRDFFQEKFGSFLQKINEGIEREGSFYLFALRLVPLFPFFVINIVMGLTNMRVLTFFVVSQIGMLAGTIAYVNAGTQLANIESMSEILSPKVLLAFALLGLVPLVSKWIINYIRNRKALKAFKKPKHFDYNVVIIGAGSAGLVSAYIASTLKAKVALIEKNKMGGDCLNTGCVPSKSIIRVSKLLADAKRATDFGLKSLKANFDFAEVMEHIQTRIKKIEPHDSIERYTKLGVDCFQGEAKILSPYVVKVKGKELTTKNIIIASGGRPKVPKIKGIEDITYYTSDTIWEIRKQPKRFLVLGGGPIGVELAQSFQRLGSEVTVVHRRDQLLHREDPDVAEVILEQFKKEGVNVILNDEVKAFTSPTTAQLKSGQEITFDVALIALGRELNLRGFGLKELGLEYNKDKKLHTNPNMTTNFPNIYVCGDAAGSYQFTHAAAHMAWHASVNSLLKPFANFKIDYKFLPWCTFTDPEVARVGLNETEAKAKNIPHEVTLYDLSELDRAIADVEDHGLVKVITKKDTDKILGVTIVGHNAGEIIVEFITAMKHDLGLNKILSTIHIYPTYAEANKYAAGNWKKNHTPKQVLDLLEKFHTWRRS